MHNPFGPPVDTPLGAEFDPRVPLDLQNLRKVMENPPEDPSGLQNCVGSLPFPPRLCIVPILNKNPVGSLYGALAPPPS